MTARRGRVFLVLLPAAVLAVLFSLPVSADTESQLRAAEARRDQVHAQLDRLVGSFVAAKIRLAQTEARIEAVGGRIRRLEFRLTSIVGRVRSRVVELFETGGVDTVQILLTSDSVSQFTDRLQFVGRLNEGDTDVLVQAQRTGEELRRARADLDALAGEQVATRKELDQQRDLFARNLAELQRLTATLSDRLARERAAEAARRQAALEAAARVVGGGGPLQACPVAQPRFFGNDFGDPRSGGRTHQGIDLVAPYGTPVYAAQSGRVSRSYNSLGGISAHVYGVSGDTTYYAHLSGYSSVPSGASVPAGTVIGYVGNTGNAAGGPYHLHFEYRPRGGGAVNPYYMLRAICG